MEFSTKEELTILNATITQSASKRYGLKLYLQTSNKEHSFPHIVWFGNYRDFDHDEIEKNQFMWQMVTDFLELLGKTKNDLTNLPSFDGVTFLADLDVYKDEIQITKIYKGEQS